MSKSNKDRSHVDEMDLTIDSLTPATVPAKHDDRTLQERTNGLTIVYDKVDGTPILRLLNNVRIECGKLQNDWYRVALKKEVTIQEARNGGIIKVGAKLMANGLEIGEFVSDFSFSGASWDNAKGYLRIDGVVRKENIRSESIVESVFVQRIGQVRSRLISDYRQMIHDFGMHSSRLPNSNYEFFSVSESVVDDPSPSFRFGFVSRNDSIVGILHSRPVKVNGAIEILVDDRFSFLCFSTRKEGEAFIKLFNEWTYGWD